MDDNGRVEGWIVVRNWERYQHRDALRGKEHGAPPWIKNHLVLLSDDDYLALTAHQRAVFHGILLMYASSHGQCPANTRSMSRRLCIHRITRSDLEALNHAGFIEFSASKPPAFRQPRVEESRGEPTLKGSRFSSGTTTRSDAPAGANAPPPAPENLDVATKKAQAMIDFLRRMWDEYPDESYLVLELTDRGCRRDEAEDLVAQERARRSGMVTA